MTAAEDVWVVAPAYNEGTVIAGVLQKLVATGHQIVVVDDGSHDDTRAQAEAFAVHVLSHCVNLGQGAALQTGLTYALKNGAKYVVTFDTDGQHDVADIAKLLSALESGPYDVALGSRFLGTDSAVGMPWAKRVLLKAALRYTKTFGAMKVSDTHNGLKAFTASAAGKIELTQNRYAHGDQLLAQLHEHRMRFVEVSVTVHYTPYSIRKGQKLSNAFNIVWDSLMERLHL